MSSPERAPKGGAPLTAPDLRGRVVCLDPGHCEGRPGCQGGPPDYPSEDILNRLQADWIRQRLESAGCQVVLADDPEDDLATIGAHAMRCDCFVSLHHNAFDRLDHHTFACVHRRHSSAGSIELAHAISSRVSLALGLPLRADHGEIPGVVRQALAVLRTAEMAGCPACVLVESYFIDAYGDAQYCRGRSLTAADAIAGGVISWLTRP